MLELPLRKTWRQWAEECGDRIMDPDGFRDNEDQWLYERKEYKQRLMACTISLSRPKSPDELPSISPALLPDPRRRRSQLAMAHLSAAERMALFLHGDPAPNTDTGRACLALGLMAEECQEMHQQLQRAYSIIHDLTCATEVTAAWLKDNARFKNAPPTKV